MSDEHDEHLRVHLESITSMSRFNDRFYPAEVYSGNFLKRVLQKLRIIKKDKGITFEEQLQKCLGHISAHELMELKNEEK